MGLLVLVLNVWMAESSARTMVWCPLTLTWFSHPSFVCFLPGHSKSTVIMFTVTLQGTRLRVITGDEDRWWWSALCFPPIVFLFLSSLEWMCVSVGVSVRMCARVCARHWLLRVVFTCHANVCQTIFWLLSGLVAVRCELFVPCTKDLLTFRGYWENCG